MAMKKVAISKQAIYIFITSIVLLIIVFTFSFNALIPKGKEYRNARIDLKKEHATLDQYSQKYDETFQKLKELQSKNAHIIQAYDSSFKPDRFIKQNSQFFTTLKLQTIKEATKAEPFYLYEVKTESSIVSPENFYKFLESINKSDWIIRVDFPVIFERDERVIKSQFTMKVFSNNPQKYKENQLSK
ncbi:MAG: hypothetical protein U9N42_09180 [Campylobacterota bacterium]|nr:hypothetical protein [Campylobacterota bacterium]